MNTSMLWALALLGVAHGVTVDTKYGAVTGQSHILHTGKEVNSFLAVPYAKAPVGELRFAKPQEPEVRDGEFVADTLGDACIQNPIGLLWLTHFGWTRYSEDCLHLNIYTPKEMSGGPYAVMVWFHGGAYSSSANIQYPGYFLAGEDTVVVVANYRLGILGFGTTGDDVAAGNWGLWDQNLAMKFVQENIANFGGDPNKVMIFGQSAGASSTGIHMVSPESQDLFHSAGYHSGSEFTLWAVNYPESNPENYIRQVADNINCPDAESSQGIIDCLRGLDAQFLNRNADFDCTPGFVCLGHAPVVDGPNGFLPATPQELRGAGNYNKVPVLAGQTNKDGSLYTIAFIPEAEEGGFNRTYFQDIIRNRLVEIFAPRVGNDNRTVEDIYQAMDFFYTPWPYVDDEEANRQAFNDMITDAGFGYAGDVVYKSQAETNDVYYYLLAYRSAKAVDLIPEWMGVPHNGELPYVWGYPLLQLNPSIRLESEMLEDVIEWDELDIKFAEYMIKMWANFAKFGNPTPEPVDAPDGSQTTWKKFADGDLNYLYINNTIEDKMDYNQKNFAFWTDYLSYVSGIDVTFESQAKSEAPSSEGFRIRSDHIEKTTNKWMLRAVKKVMEKKYGFYNF